MYKNLYVAMKVYKVTQSQIAKLLGISKATVWRKLKGWNEFKSSEMQKIKAVYFPEEEMELLFAKGDEYDG